MGWKSIAKAMIVMVLAVASASGWAQTTRNEALAESLFQEGRRLFQEKKVPEACAKFTASYEVDNALGTLLNLAVCHEQDRKFASAWLEFSNAAAMASATPGAPNAREREKFARERIKALAPKLIYVTFEVPHRVSGMVLQLDGGLIPENAWNTMIPVDPGEHLVEVSAPGKEKWTKSVVVSQAKQKVVVAVPELAVYSGPARLASGVLSAHTSGQGKSSESEAMPLSAESKVKTEGGGHFTRNRIAAYSLAGAAVVLAAVAVAEQVHLHDLDSEIGRLKAPGTGFIAPGNEARYHQLNSSAKRAANWRMATAIGAGAAAAGAGVFLWFEFSPRFKAGPGGSGAPGVSLGISGAF